MRYFYTVLILLFFGNAFAQSPEVQIAVDTTQIKIGEQFEYKIIVPNHGQVTFPDVKLKGLELVESLDKQTIKDQVVKKYVITGFDSGAYYIGKQEVFIDAKAYFTDSLLIHVASVKIDTAYVNQLVNLKKVEQDPVTFSEIISKYRIYILCFFILFVIGLALSYFLLNKKSKQKKQTVEIPPYQVALQEFKNLAEKDLWQQHQIKLFYSELTDIVRKYLGNELSVSALETTTDELLRSLKHENTHQNLGITKETFERLNRLLLEADFVKFAKQKPLEPQIKGHQSDAKQIVETIHEIIIAKQKESQHEV